MPRLQRVLNQLFITVIVAAIFQWVDHPEQGYILLTYLVRVVTTAGIVYCLYWVHDTFEVRRRQ